MELPLFPLKTVLFPGTPVHLHVFEERYKGLISRCIERGQPFGVVLIRKGIEAAGPLPEPHAVGCTAQIRHVEPLGDGRMNIVAVGDERFRIVDLHSDHAYLVGEVEPLTIDPSDPTVLAETGRQLRYWVERYLAVLAAASEQGATLDAGQLPSDPLSLAYVAASLLPLPARTKQALLGVDAADALVTDVCSMYRRELPLLEHMIAHRSVEQAGPFSRN